MQVANDETIRTPSDGFTHRRMKDYMKPEDLNTDGVVMLASAVLAEAAAVMLELDRQAERRR